MSEPVPLGAPEGLADGMNRLFCSNGCDSEFQVWIADDLSTWWITCGECQWEITLEPQSPAFRGMIAREKYERSQS